jgi:hypothetical protein
MHVRHHRQLIREVKRMKSALRFFVFALCLHVGIPCLSAQSLSAPSSVRPPRLLLLVHQQFQSGKAAERRKLASDISRACDHLTVPNAWIDLQAVTGSPEALSFDPFDSFAQIDDAFVAWPQLFASHPALARMQQQIDALVTSERTLIAVRRDDLSFRSAAIDLSKMRFLRVLEIRLHPGRENDFAEAFKILSAAYEKINATTPWVVYQVNSGMTSPTFLAFVPMHALKQNDDLLGWRQSLRDAEGEQAALRMQQIAREAYLSTESDLFAVSPATSHVPKETVDGDPDFWLARPTLASSGRENQKPVGKSAARRSAGESR